MKRYQRLFFYTEAHQSLPKIADLNIQFYMQGESF